MKGLIIAVHLIVVLAGHGHAKTLEEVLKEKGVISEEDYREVTKSRPDYKRGEGYILSSPDARFKMTIGASIQARYTLLDADDINNTPAKQVQDMSRFELRRVKFFVKGFAYTEDLSYQMRVNFANLQGGTNLNGGLMEEVFVNYRVLDPLQFRLGQDKVPFARQFVTSTTTLQFPDLSFVTTAMVPGYDTGLLVHGKGADDLLHFYLGGYGGVGQNTFRTTTDNALAARLVLNPLGEMKESESDVENSKKPLASLGASFFMDTVNRGTSSGGLETNSLYFGKSTTGWFAIGSPLMPAAQQFSSSEAIDFKLLGLEAAFKWHGVSLQGEYFFDQAKGQVTRHQLRGQGYYIQGGFFVIPEHLELAGRYGALDPSRDVADDRWVEATGAVSWYFDKHNLKIQSDYTNIHKQRRIAFNGGPSATDDQQVRIQLQLLF
jgi:phosphate-selective porin OprO/OprP